MRYLPPQGALVEITQRTIEGRFAFRPSAEVDALFVGCLARARQRAAQKNTAVQIHAVAVLSNHFHLLASFESTEQMAEFMCHFKANLSKEIGHLHGKTGPLYPSRYTHVPVSDEPEAQLARLRYVLAQGTKEGLVASPLDWPGVQSAKALLDGEPLRGTWVERSKLRGKKSWSELDLDHESVSSESLDLEPLPALASLEPEARRDVILGLVREIEEDAAANHRLAHSRAAGAEAVSRRSPDARPRRSKRSPAPRVHAFRREVRETLLDARRWFLVAYREAADRLKAGDREASFPPNCYPPGLPFVPAMAA